MTTTYDPFIPAGGSEQHGYGARRRPEERWDADPYADQYVDPYGADPRPSTTRPADPWGAEPQQPSHWMDDPRWGTGQQPVQQAPVSYAPAPAPGPSYAVPQQAASPMGPSMAVPMPAPRGSGSSWNRTVSIVVVAMLVALAGYQAYRIEGVSRDNQALVADLSAEQTKTANLQKQMSGYFDPEAISTKVLPSVFRVRAGDFTGTAFSVGDKAADGKANLFTNYHVVDEVYSSGSRKVTLERGTTSIAATIVKVDKNKDLALLQAAQSIAPLAAASGQVKPGQPVVVVGAPLGLDDTVTSGVISAFRPNDPDGTTIQFDAAINPGNSGGPVVNANDQVVGLATAKAKDAEGIGLAIAIGTACDTFDVC